MSGQIWEIVGGKENGGIIVRESKELTSPLTPERLSFGSLVEELIFEDGRMQFKRLTGTGPDTGWASTHLKGKALIIKTEKRPPKKFDPYAILGVSPDATDAMIKSAFRKASVRCHPDRNPDDPDAAQKFQELTKAKEFLLNPLKRLLYNARNKLIKPKVNEVWWSDWDEIFEEIDPVDPEVDRVEQCGPQPMAPLDGGRIDILIVGATGMTGTMACMVMQRQHARTWAIAGRDGRKLDCLRNKFGTRPSFKGATCVESCDDLWNLAKMARLVVDFRGPMYQVGTDLGEACVQAGTHYLINSGDVIFNKPFREKVHAAAQAKGVCLSSGVGIMVTLCDVATWYLVKQVREKYGLPTRRVDKYEHAVGQMLSGSMIASGLARDHKEIYQEIQQGGGPFFLGGVRRGGVREEDGFDEHKTEKDPYSGFWALPASNPEAHYVRCSCGLFDELQPWGDDFLFKSHVLFPTKLQAESSITMGEFAKRFYQKSLDEKRIPPPGCGPNERLRQECFFTHIFVAEADEPSEPEPRKIHCILQAGPGGMADRFEGAATIALEFGMCLLDSSDAGLELRSGWGTPAWHLAHLGFFERLLAKGISMRMLEGAPKADFFKNLLASTLPIGDDSGVNNLE